MKTVFLSILLLFVFTTPARAVSPSVYSPGGSLPLQGQYVQGADGSWGQISGSCFFGAPLTGASALSKTLVESWNMIPCRDGLVVASGYITAFQDGGLNASGSCDYPTYWACPVTTPATQDYALDWSKTISFILGGLTGLGFVLAASTRW